MQAMTLEAQWVLFLIVDLAAAGLLLRWISRTFR